MANKKLTDLTELTTPADNDFLYIVDVSDTTESAQGTSKKIRKDKVDSGVSKENISNKQNSLAIDGTGTKYPTIDAVNTIDLQKVIDVNGSATAEDGLGKIGALYVGVDFSAITNENSERGGALTISDGFFEISQADYTAGINTIVKMLPPASETLLNFPAKTVAGTYTLATTDETVNLTGNQTISDKKDFEQISVGTPASDVIGHPSDSFNADLSIRGSAVRIENTTGESLIINTTAYDGSSHFYDANVLAIQNKSTYLGVLSQVPSAIRFLSNTDGEMGAIGYQNGAVGTAFANSMFLAASMPYYPSNPLVAPTRLALIQEGDYLGALTKVERLEFNSDWSTKFKTPNGTPRITIPVEGRILINNATDNLTDDLQINGSLKATTLKGNSLTSNFVLKATTNGQITNSTITDNGTNVGIGNASTSPAENLEVRTTGNAGFAMTRNAIANLSRFYFKTGTTYNWSTGIRNTRNDYSIFNEVSSLEAFTINSTTNNVLIGTTTDISSSKLTISSTTQGVLLPRMTTAQINAISSPVRGLTAFNTDLDTLCFYTTSWQKVTSTTM